jgi:hypothetical protein
MTIKSEQLMQDVALLQELHTLFSPFRTSKCADNFLDSLLTKVRVSIHQALLKGKSVYLPQNFDRTPNQLQLICQQMNESAQKNDIWVSFSNGKLHAFGGPLSEQSPPPWKAQISKRYGIRYRIIHKWINGDMFPHSIEPYEYSSKNVEEPQYGLHPNDRKLQEEDESIYDPYWGANHYWA